MEPVHRYRSARNGFVVVSVLLFAFVSVEYLQQGSWDYALATAFFLSQAAFWASWAYYSRA